MNDVAATTLDLNCSLAEEFRWRCTANTVEIGQSTLWLLTPKAAESQDAELVRHGAEYSLVSEGRVVPLAKVRSMSNESIGLHVPDMPFDSSVFDRQVRLLGSDGQAILHRLHVGVIGASGTGSPTIEQLTRLGVGELTVIDPKLMAASNVTRMHGANLRDVDRPKVEIARDSALGIGLGTVVHAIQGDVRDKDVARRLCECDILFVCTDDHTSRNIASRLSYRYLIPTINMGVQVDSRDGVVHGIFGRVVVVGPGLPCLTCAGQVNGVRLRAESLPENERRKLVAEGYLKDLPGEAPAVIAYTTAVSALAINAMMNRFFGLGSAPEHQLLWFHRGQMFPDRYTSAEGHYCVNPEFIGKGDSIDFLDLSWR